ncbi:hypothetical protein IEQ34_007216 [Dendrobium chrysotoxum]|uniref:Uncharacterized protein n=1 Tax=Dendrobium chrysotoxum TaxID=161865 RepID=A0AAV7GRG7_DENCH|nr:hypothetical protein IEQ34_007216 [Dendrobium chrysotoxum]
MAQKEELEKNRNKNTHDLVVEEKVEVNPKNTKPCREEKEQRFFTDMGMMKYFDFRGPRIAHQGFSSIEYKRIVEFIYDLPNKGRNNQLGDLLTCFFIHLENRILTIKLIMRKKWDSSSCNINIYELDDCIVAHIDSHDFMRSFCTIIFNVRIQLKNFWAKRILWINFNSPISWIVLDDFHIILDDPAKIETLIRATKLRGSD